MLNKDLAQFYERDLRQLIEEVNLFPTEAGLWRTTGLITNSAGNLVLHIVGGMNHHIGTNIACTGYVRNRDLEFTQKDVPRVELIAGLEALITLINQTLSALTPEQLAGENPAFFDQPGTSMQYVLVQLLVHLNYHRGPGELPAENAGIRKDSFFRIAEGFQDRSTMGLHCKELS